MEVNKQDFCLLVLPSITRALYDIGKQNAALGFAAFKMLNDYAITGEEPQGVENITLKILFGLVAPVIDDNRRKTEAQRENGKKGGRPRTRTEEAATEEAATEECTEEGTEEGTDLEVIEPEIIIPSEREKQQKEWQKYWQDLCVTTNLPLARLNEYKEQFEAHCRVSKKEHKDLQDWQSHFYAWLCKQKEFDRRKTAAERKREANAYAIKNCMASVSETLSKGEFERQKRDAEFAEHVRKKMLAGDRSDEIPF